MSNLINKLKAYGADIDSAMERFLDDEELYEDCIKDFSQDEGFEHLKKYIDEKSYKEAFDCAHTLKGVAGNLGLDPLFKVTSSLVESLRSENYNNLDELCLKISEEHQRIKEILEEAANI